MADDDDYVEDAAERIESAMSMRGGRGKAGRGGRGGGGGGGGGGKGGGTRDSNVALSKALSMLLRHQAHSAGIKLDAEGYAPLDKVLQWPRLRALNMTVADVQAAVADSAKQRFAMKPNPNAKDGSSSSDPASWLIRANQGHSIALASEGLHTAITLEAGNVPPVVVHGTYFAFWDPIVAAGGLRKMGRTHVHFGTGLLPGDDSSSLLPPAPTGTAGSGVDEDGKPPQPQGHDAADESQEATQQQQVISGMRADAELLIFMDVERSLRDEAPLKWWLSANEVVLTEGDENGLVPLKYVKEVRGRKQGVGVLWRDGEKVADLPADVVKRVPFGKTASGGRGRGGGGGGGGGRGKGKGRGRGR